MIGYLFMLALVLIFLSLFIFEELEYNQKIILGIVILYFCILICLKYKGNLQISIVILLLFVFIYFKNNQNTYLKIDNDQILLVHPDQVKIKDNWLTGTGYIGKNPILLTGNISKKVSNLFATGKTLSISINNAEINRIESATNFGEFDYRHYYSSKNIFQSIKSNNYSVLGVKEDFSSKIHGVRFNIQKYFSKMPKLLSFFSSELLLAENNLEDKEIIDNYKTLGIIHLLSISGLHVGIYTIFLSKILYYLKVEEHKVAIICTIMLMIGIFLSNFQAGFVRASIGYTLSQLLSAKKMKLSELDQLGITSILHLLIVPRLFCSIGAILSYVLAFGLRITSGFTNRWKSTLINLLLTPFLLISYSQINVLTMLFNLIAVPYFNYLVMPITFLNLLLFGINRNFSLILENILESTEKLIASLSNKQLGLFTFGKINLLELEVIVVTTVIIIGTLNQKQVLKKYKKILASILLLIYSFAFIRIHCPIEGQVTFIDVGQGDSILVTTPFPRKVYMIDTGGKLNFLHKKTVPQVNRITLPFLHAQGIDKIDGLFVSHQDADHVGDIKPLLEQISVKKLYMAKGLIENPSFKKRIQDNVRNTELVELLAGMPINDGKMQFQIVYPFEKGSGKNEDSLSLTFVINGFRWLFTGDLGQEGEKEIMQKYHLHADYFKLGHHGSKTSSNYDFLKDLHPKMVFISAGRNNRFGHPHAETILTLKKLGIPWVSTQDCGMISWYYGKNGTHFNRFVREDK